MQLVALTESARGDRFRQVYPELAAMATSEVERLRDQVPTPGPTLQDSRADRGGKYDLSHLVQPLDQQVGGPVQDDEALLLYAAVRTMRVRRVLEIGGLSGYSARNFVRAMAWERKAEVYTVDLNPVESVAPNHHTICKDAALLTPDDLHGQPLDLVFFDCHVFDAQMDLFVRLKNHDLIHDKTVIALHDTNLHPRKQAPWAYPVSDADGSAGFVHQAVERRMVNVLRSQFGYDAFCAHTDMLRHDDILPARHGLTLMRKFSELRT